MFIVAYPKTLKIDSMKAFQSTGRYLKCSLRAWHHFPKVSDRILMADQNVMIFMVRPAVWTRTSIAPKK